MDVVNLADKFRSFTEAWSPRIVGARGAPFASARRILSGR